MNNLLTFIPVTPLIGALFILLFGRRFSASFCAKTALVMAFLPSAFTGCLWLNHHQIFQKDLYTWMSIGQWQPHISFYVDQITLVMLTVATGIGFLIHLFSLRFIGGESGERRYFFYLNLFLVGMTLFVMADDLVLLYCGWEVMGLCSYALVAYYFQTQYNAFCGRKAFVVTRIGDTALAIGIIIIFSSFHTTHLPTIFQQVQEGHGHYFLISCICLLLFIAAIAKSAQFPLHIWLPNAMTGPSTVSALIHAATMITAGVYLLIRFHVLLDFTFHLRLWIAIFGCITIILASASALAQSEIKRILAYSTISQIGYMFTAIGVGAYSFALFHLIVHACFKALLFMSSGIIVNLFNTSNIYQMGGLAKQQPFLHIAYLIGSLTLAALPLFTASFYSKDAIIASLVLAPHGIILVSLGLFGAWLTSMYAMRMYFMVFSSHARSPIAPYRIPQSMKIPLAILAVLSVSIGFIEFPDNWSWGPHYFTHWISSAIQTNALPSNTCLLLLQVIGSLIVLLGIALSYFLVKIELNKPSTSKLHDLLKNGFYIDALFRVTFVHLYDKICRILSYLEQCLFHRLGVHSIVYSLTSINIALKKMHAGLLQRYFYFMISGIVALLAYTLWLFFRL